MSEHNAAIIGLRIKKKLYDYIELHFSNKSTFLRKSLEYVTSTMHKRMEYPVGYCTLTVGFSGCIKYYYGVKDTCQFIIIKNIDGKTFEDAKELYFNTLISQLEISNNEEITFYYVSSSISLDGTTYIYEWDKWNGNCQLIADSSLNVFLTGYMQVIERNSKFGFEERKEYFCTQLLGYEIKQYRHGKKC